MQSATVCVCCTDLQWVVGTVGMIDGMVTASNLTVKRLPTSHLTSASPRRYYPRHMRRCARLFPVALVAAVSLSRTGLANGRFPAADQLVVDPADPQHMVVRTTFGLLVTRDEGNTWGWVCEEVIGYAQMTDPSLLVLRNGNILAGLADGFHWSGDDGCSWNRVDGENSEAIVDLVLDPASNAALALVQRSDPKDVRVVQFDGDSVRDVGMSLGGDFYPTTIEVAGGDPKRLYASGLGEDGTSLFFRSEDRGENWERIEIPLRPGLPPYISAVDPTDPSRVYVRLDGAMDDALLVSDDSGDTFEEKLSFAGDMLGFALSPDGSQIAVGGPGDGLLVASARELVFSTAGDDSVTNATCLTWTAAGLYGCGKEAVDGWTVARSTNTGESFVPLFHLADAEPLVCADSSPFEEECPNAWPFVAVLLGIDEASAGVDQPSGASNGSQGSGCSFDGSPSRGGIAFVLIGLFISLIGRATRSREPRSAAARSFGYSRRRL